MKNVLISLLALAALSGAALASDSVDLRDSDTYFGKYSAKHQSQATDSNAFAVANDGAALTAFERMQKISEENEHGRK
jgi:opacity protein-like surface antigen